MKCYFLLIGIICLVFAQAQTQDFKRGYHWYFGNFAGLDFSSGSPVFSKGSLYSFEGCASISDKNGNLLFYTNGGGRDTMCPWWSQSRINQYSILFGAIWNPNHDIMENGYMYGHQGGGLSARQSSVIIPDPADEDQYYVFTMEEAEVTSPFMPLDSMICDTSIKDDYGVKYFKVDMSQNGGAGRVTEFDVSFFHPTTSENIGATVHANGTDYWLLFGSATTLYISQISDTGITPPANTGISNGSIKFSPDASKLMVWSTLYDFNNTTGAITNPRNINNCDHEFSFSPDSRFLYGESSGMNFRMYQFDITLGSAAAINGSRINIGKLPESNINGKQIGPDGKIYIGHAGKKFLSVIHCPNASGVDCNLDSAAIPLDSVCGMGLPNFIDAWFASNDSCGSPVPVNFTDFSGYSDGDRNILKWITAMETNNESYTIQRSEDNRKYENIGMVTGSGNSTERRQYDFIDDNPPVGLNYYRLKQTDFDGTSTLSNVISIFTGDDQSITLSPNPAVNDLNIVLNGTFDENIQLTIINVLGQKVYERAITTDKSNTKISVSTGNFTGGVYRAIIHSEDATTVMKTFMVKR